MANPRRTGLLAALLLLVLVLLGGALFLVLGGDGAEPPPDAPPEQPAVTREERPRPAAEKTPQPREHVTESSEDAPPSRTDGGGTGIELPVPTHSPIAPQRTVRVLVVHEGGVPVRDAHVAMFSAFGAISATPDDATTDVDGRVTLVVDGTSSFQLRAWTDDAAAIGERLSAQPDAVLDVTLTLQPGRAVAGRVETEVSTPIEGARVEVTLPTTDPFGLRLSTQSDGEGRFDLGVVPTKLLDTDGAQILAWARGHSPLRKPLPDEPDTARVLLRLERGQTIRGRCVAVGAAPVAGVSVTGSALDDTRTARDGTFELEGVSRQGGVLLISPTEHVVPPPIQIAPGTGEVDLGDILLLAGRPISGVVVDDQDRPVPRAMVQAVEQETQRQVRTTSTDKQGRFTLEHLGEGPHTIVAKPSQGGDWSARLAGSVADVTAGTTGLRVVLSGGLTLLVEFRSAADREPVKVASAEVEVTRTDVEGGRTRSAWAGPGMTSVRVSFDSAGRYTVVVKVPGYEEATLEDIEILDDRATHIDALFRQLPE